MNAGLSNLDKLKKALLGNGLAADPQFDIAIKAIGLGMAGLCETFCNRQLAYLENDTLIFSGDRSHYYLPRFPIVSVDKVEMRYFIADDWTDITGQPISWNPETGLLHFGYTLGRNPLQVKVTYTGGFWYEMLEPDDDTYPSDLPTAITDNQQLEARKFRLPDTLQSAWLLQCQEVWNKRDKLGMGMADVPDKQVSLERLALIPIVKQMLQPFVRYQLT
jgi:hypothetical protein